MTVKTLLRRALLSVGGDSRANCDLPILPLETRQLLDAVVWTGAAGDNLWHTPGNWLNVDQGVAVVPTASDDVTIDVPGTPTILFTAASGNRAVNSLTSHEALTVSGGTLTVGTLATFEAIVTMSGGTLSGGTWTFTGAGNRINGTNLVGTLNNVTVNGEIVLASSARLTIAGSTSFTMARLTGGSADLRFNAGTTINGVVQAEGPAGGTRFVTIAANATGTATLGAASVIRLAPGAAGDLWVRQNTAGTLVNNGLISAEAVGRALSVRPNIFTNNATAQAIAGTLSIDSTNWTSSGAITATGATLVFAGTWSNTGTLAVSDSTLNLGGNFTTAGLNLPGFTRTGGTVNLTGTLNNTQATLTLNAATGSWIINGGTINGGTVALADGAALLAGFTIGTLNDVAVDGDVLLAESTRLTISGSTSFGIARLMGSGAVLRINAGTTINGVVQAEGAASGTREVILAMNASGTVTLGASGVIRLAAGTGGNLTLHQQNAATLVNHGLISAEAAGRTLSINPNALTNHGTLQVTAGTLNVIPTNWTNLGATTVTGGTLNLGGTLDATDGLGTWSRSGGTVNLTGTLNNASMTLDASTGSWNISGATINGGTVAGTDGASLLATTAGGTLNDVTVNGDLVLAADTRITIAGSTSFGVARLTGNNADLRFNAGTTINGVIQAEGAATGERHVTLASNANGTVTIGSGGEIRLAAGSGGDLWVRQNFTAALVNNGIIAAEAAGRTLMIVAIINNFTNSGTLSTSAGTLTVNATNWTNTGATMVSGGALNIGGTLDGTVGVGTWNRTGGTVNLTGTLINTESTLTLDATTGSWNLNGGTINGGTVNFSDDAVLLGSTLASVSTLINVTLNGELVLTTSATVTIAGTTSFEVARMMSGGSQLRFNAGTTISGLILAEGPAMGTRLLTLATNNTGTVTLAPGAEIRLAADSGGGMNIWQQNASTLENYGLISSEAPGRTLQFEISTLTNHGTIQINGGTLVVNATNWTNEGAIIAAESTVNLSGIWSNQGSLSVSDSTLNLGGNFTRRSLNTAGFSRSGGTVNITGTLHNTTAHLTLNALTGSFILNGGTITGGTVTFIGGHSLITTSAGGTLNNVTVFGDLILPTNTRLTLAGNVGFGVARLMGGAAQLRINAATTINGVIQAEGEQPGARSLILAYNTNGPVTLGAGSEIRLAANSGGNLAISQMSTATLVNNGLISAESQGQPLTITTTALTNNGIVRAAANTLTINNTTNYAAAVNTLTGGIWEVMADATLALNGATILTLGPDTHVLLSGTGSSFPAISTLSTNNGTLELAEGRNLDITPVNNKIDNNGTFVKSGSGTSTVGPAITFNNIGFVNVTGGTLAFGGASFRVPQISGTTLAGGSWRVDDTAGLGSSLQMPAGAVFTVLGNGATVTFAGAAPSFPALQNLGTNNGTLIFADNASFLLTPPSDTLANTGTVRKEGAGMLTLPSSLTINNGVGTVEVVSGGLVIEGSIVGGTVRTTGTGTLSLMQDTTLNAALLVNNGTVNLGVHTLTLAGAYTQGAMGLLDSAVAAESQMGNIVAGDAISLGGTLRVVSVGGFDPAYGHIHFAHDIVRGTSRTGEFAEADLPSTAVGAYALRYFPDRAELIFNIADFNGDGAVDGADIEAFFLFWEDGSIFTDINLDGGVDGGDVEAFFAIWEGGGG